jgi:hypothetical protein
MAGAPARDHLVWRTSAPRPSLGSVTSRSDRSGNRALLQIDFEHRSRAKFVEERSMATLVDWTIWRLEAKLTFGYQLDLYNLPAKRGR